MQSEDEISGYVISANGANLKMDITVNAMHDHDNENAKLSTSWLVPNCTRYPHNISIRAINTNCSRNIQSRYWIPRAVPPIVAIMTKIRITL